MRTEQVWDKWMEYDEEEFCSVLRSDAPANVKEAYEEYIEAQKDENGNLIKY